MALRGAWEGEMRKSVKNFIGYYEFAFEDEMRAAAYSRLIAMGLSAECSDRGIAVPFYFLKKLWEVIKLL